MLNFCDFIQVYVFTTNHHLKQCTNVTDILKMRKYLSEGKNCNFDKITAVLYLE